MDRPWTEAFSAGSTRETTPETMAEYAARYLRNGARIVGGFCGSTPEHVGSIADCMLA